MQFANRDDKGDNRGVTRLAVPYLGPGGYWTLWNEIIYYNDEVDSRNQVFPGQPGKERANEDFNIFIAKREKILDYIVTGRNRDNY